jgi:hypothetical protein
MASSWNPLDSIVAVGIPAFSKATMSWIIHDVHDPQSAVQPMAASTSLIAWSMRAVGVGSAPL